MKNTVHQLAVLVNNEEITVGDMEAALDGAHHPEHIPMALREAQRRFERAFITECLMAHQWRIAPTAQALGLECTHLYKKMKELDIPADRQSE